MLVLSRKIGESLVIGDNVTVTVTKVTGNRVTLSIEAPRDVAILRGELEKFGRSPAPAGGEGRVASPTSDWLHGPSVIYTGGNAEAR